MTKLLSNVVIQKKCLEPLDFLSLAELDLAFHKEMYDAARVSDLWKLVCQRSGQIDRLRRLNLPAEGKAQAIVRDHEAIVRALMDKDISSAEKALRVHLSGTLSFVKEIKKLYPDWVKD